jgi:hypothetical protein
MKLASEILGFDGGQTLLIALEILNNQDVLFEAQVGAESKKVFLSDLRISDNKVLVICEIIKMSTIPKVISFNFFTHNAFYSLSIKSDASYANILSSHRPIQEQKIHGLLPQFEKNHCFHTFLNPNQPGIEKLNERYLSKTLIGIIGNNIYESLDFPIGSEIILQSLGLDFWAKECTTFGNPQTWFKNGDFGTTRIIQLAVLIWNLRNCDNFDHMLEKCRRDQDFEKVFYELYAANMIQKLADSVEFNIETGIKGQDYDLIAYNLFGIERINIEVKSKDQPFKSIKSLENYFKKYKQQLNRDQPGAIICNVVGIGFTLDQLAESLKKLMKKSSRIKFISILVELKGDDFGPKGNKTKVLTYGGFFINKDGQMNVQFQAGFSSTPSYMLDTLEYINMQIH